MEKYMSVDNISSYYEQVVQKRTTTGAVAKITLIATGILIFVGICVILAVTVAAWIFPVALISIGLGIYFIIRMIKTSGVEYEYTFVTGELRIARIKGRTKRRNITYFDVKNIDDMGRFIDPKTGRKNIDTKKYNLILHAAADDYSLDTYYFIIHDKIRHQPAVLLMTPNEKTLSFVKPYLSVELKKKFMKLQKEEEQLRAVNESSDNNKAAPDTEKDSTKEAEDVKTETNSSDNSQKKNDSKKNGKSKK